MAAVGTLLLVAGAGSEVVDRAMSLFTDTTGSIAFRVATYGLALQGVQDHLMLGLGTNSFGQHVLDPTQGYNPAYVGGMFIATLWDIGVIGLGLLLVAFATVAKRLRQALASVDDVVRSQAAGFSAAFICALIAYQATNGFWFAYNWILIGLAASIPIGVVVKDSKRWLQDSRST